MGKIVVKLESGIYFSSINFCNLDVTCEFPQMSFLEVYFSEQFYFDYQAKTVTRKSNNKIHKIYQWDNNCIKFESFKL